MTEWAQREKLKESRGKELACCEWLWWETMECSTLTAAGPNAPNDSRTKAWKGVCSVAANDAYLDSLDLSPLAAAANEVVAAVATWDEAVGVVIMTSERKSRSERR